MRITLVAPRVCDPDLIQFVVSYDRVSSMVSYPIAVPGPGPNSRTQMMALNQPGAVFPVFGMFRIVSGFGRKAGRSRIWSQQLMVRLNEPPRILLRSVLNLRSKTLPDDAVRVSRTFEALER